MTTKLSTVITIEVSTGLNSLMKLIDDTANVIVSETSSDNNVNGKLNDIMAAYLVVSAFNSYLSSRYKDTKSILDETFKELVGPIDAEAGHTIMIGQSKELAFYKKKNNNSVSIDIKKVRLGLERAGVDEEIIAKCFDDAKGVTNGNTYYEIRAI